MGVQLDRRLRAPRMVVLKRSGVLCACGEEVASEQGKDKDEPWRTTGTDVWDGLTIRSSGTSGCRFVSSGAPRPPAESAGSCSALYPLQSWWRRSPPAQTTRDKVTKNKQKIYKHPSSFRIEQWISIICFLLRFTFKDTWTGGNWPRSVWSPPEKDCPALKQWDCTPDL